MTNLKVQKARARAQRMRALHVSPEQCEAQCVVYVAMAHAAHTVANALGVLAFQKRDNWVVCTSPPIFLGG